MPAPRVHIELDEKGDRIVLRSPFFPGVSEMCQEVPGHNWSKTRRCWSYPLSLHTCRLLRHVFTDMLVIGKRLSAWARQARSEEHTSELQSLMRISYAVFCLKKKKDNKHSHSNTT